MPAAQEQEFNLVKSLLARFERHPVVDVTEPLQIPPELQSYVQKVETLTPTQQPQTVITSYTPPPVPRPLPTVSLPITLSQYIQAKKANISDSIRWLAAWCLRILKMYGSRASFRPEPNL
jgi:hypothetical protein